MSISYASPFCVTDAFLEGLRPDPDQTIDQWADEHMELPEGLSAEPGRWRTSRTPFLREIMKELSPSSPTEEVVFMKPTQMAGTAAGLNWMGYNINQAPGPMLIVEPTVDIAKKLSKLRLQPMLDQVACLKGKVSDARSRDSGNTTLMKEFTGGVLALVGANSGPGLRFMSARYLMLDEVDGYPQDVDDEGHPVDLARNRTTSFANRKIYLVSSPGDVETSIIEPAYEAGSRGLYHVPCPLCLFEQPLGWSNLKYEAEWVGKRVEVRSVFYHCDHCKGNIPESQKTWMLESGHWVHADPGNPVKSYRINALYAPYGWKALAWPALVVEWLKANTAKAHGNTRLLKNFITARLAETWAETGDQVKKDTLRDRREVYPAQIPTGGLVLSAFIDVQHDRLEGECVAWGVGQESWSIDYQRFMGSPTQREVWDRADQWLQRTWTHESGVAMKIQIALIDSSYRAKEVYEFIKTRQWRRVFASKGSSQPGARLITIGSKDKLTKVQLFLIGTDTAKDTIFDRLKLEEEGPGYMHFPSAVETPDGTIDMTQYDDEYFTQLTNEARKPKFKKGVLLGHYYHKLGRNEALDMKVGNLAALALLNPNLEKLAQGWEARVKKAKQEQGIPEGQKKKSRTIRSPFIDEVDR